MDYDKMKLVAERWVVKEYIHKVADSIAYGYLHDKYLVR